MTDLDIAKQAQLRPIDDIAAKLALPAAAWSPYGRYIAKVDPQMVTGDRGGRLVLVTAMSPTPAGEGKTTTSVGLADALAHIGERTALALREPSLGPVFGVKGGAAGGGWAQVLPMEEINLHFTGDLHAITAANNLLAAMLDNHLHQGNALMIDERTVCFRRCMDMNDRQLRSVIDGLGGRSGGVPREDGFDITAASEVMATLCLSRDVFDLKERLGRIAVAYTRAGAPVTAADLKANGAMAVLLREAMKPNLVQTIAHTPAFIHGGPFANIAHGCNSLAATRLALRLADVVVSEAGFGADLGAEKFIDIKCRLGGLTPSAVVLVATVRALKHHGGGAPGDLCAPDVAAVKRGMPNLLRHLRNVREAFGLPCVVAVNAFAGDTQPELDAVLLACREAGGEAFLCDTWAKGGPGGEELARAVVAHCKAAPPALRTVYPLEASYEEKIRKIARNVYGAGQVDFAPGVRGQLKKLPQGLPVCMAKTQYSFSDDPKKLGAPEGFTISVRSVRLSAGAGFVVAFTGEIIAMPGLPKAPAAEGIDIAPDGGILGLF